MYKHVYFFKRKRPEMDDLEKKIKFGCKGKYNQDNFDILRKYWNK